MTASRDFGISYKVGDAMLKLLAQHGVDLEAASGEKHHGLPVPAVFLVATNGVIHFEYVNPDYSGRVHPDVLLAAARVSRK
jgi:peroxiredoxin